MFPRSPAIRPPRLQPRTMRSTCSAVPARPTLSSRSSVSGVATRVSARTFEYDSSPPASAPARKRQHAERPRHANPLAGGARVEPDAPRQPRGAGAEAVAPAAAEVEVADEIEQPSGRGVVMGGQLGDVIAKALELWSVHRRVSPVICCADSTPGFSTAPCDARTRDRRAIRNFSADTTRRLA